jgi:hypothetical protein
MAAYRIIRTPDARSRGAVSFYDVESISPDGRRLCIATVDTRDEARDLVARLEADDCRPAMPQAELDSATAAELAAARDQAARVRNCRKGAHGRHLAARRLWAARAAYIAADEAADCRW